MALRKGIDALEKFERLEALAKAVAEAKRLEGIVDRELQSLGYQGAAQGHLPLGGA